MTAAEAIQVMRYRLNDAESLVYTDEELLSYLNLGINAVGVQMVAANNPWCVSELALTGSTSTALPDGFHSLLPGQPCEILGGVVYPCPSDEDRTVRYFKIPVPIDSDGTIPYPEPYCSNALNVGIEMGAMRTGHDVTQEHGLHTAISGVIFPQPVQAPPQTSGGGNAKN